MNYINSFRNRCQKYMYAIKTYPHVMKEEFYNAYDMLNIKNLSGISILNIPAAGIELGTYIGDNNYYYNYETSPDFAKLGFNYCKYTDIPLKDNSMDRIIVLASLHHVEIENRINVYKEFKRLLKHNGYLIIGDVIKNSKQDRWLNEFVNKWNSKGHNGLFFDKDDSKMLEECGFIVNTKIKKYNWNFNNQDEMVDFILNLFGLDLLSEKKEKIKIINDVKEYLDYFENKDGSCGFKWELI